MCSCHVALKVWGAGTHGEAVLCRAILDGPHPKYQHFASANYGPSASSHLSLHDACPQWTAGRWLQGVCTRRLQGWPTPDVVLAAALHLALGVAGYVLDAVCVRCGN